jgi:hypothetical protein
MKPLWTVAPIALILLIVAPAAAQTVKSRCADCHLSAAAPPNLAHLADWEHSPHGRNDIGCEKCHGGDAATFESFIAHRSILAPRNPASPVHRRNVPATCGSCHPGPFVAFQNSRHYELLRQGDSHPPTCATCHGEVAARLLPAKSLARQCNSCHGADKVAPHTEYAESARMMLESIIDVRASMSAARRLIDRVPEGERRSRLEIAFEQAEVPLIQAVHDSHAFVFSSAVQRLAVSRERIEALTLELLEGSAGR